MTTEPTTPAGDPIIDREPVALFVGALVACTDALLIACDAFDWLHVTPAQTAALVAFVTSLGTLVAAACRTFVYSRATARRAGIT